MSDIQDMMMLDALAELLQARKQLTIAQRESTKLLMEKRALEQRETQLTISEWANQTFGPSGSNLRVATRANEEMAELLQALSIDDVHPKAAEEVADIFIVLYRLAWRLGVDLHKEIDKKMAINRKRQWNLDGSGHGYHVRSE